MDFTPEPADEAIVEVATKALTAPVDDPYAELARAGLLACAVPARLGGDELGPGPALALLVETGRHASAGQALATLALGVLPVVRWGTPAQQDALLADLTTQPVVLTAALREPAVPFPARPSTVVDSGGTVTGVVVGVPYADRARAMLVPVTLPGGGPGIFVVDPGAPGVTLTATPAAGGPGEFTVSLERAPGELLGGRNGGTRGVRSDERGAGDRRDGRAARSLADLYRLGQAGAAAVGAGAVAGALALTTGYIGTREQFGRPLAAFQAVAQQIADVYVTARTLRLAVASAAWRLATDRTTDRRLATDRAADQSTDRPGGDDWVREEVALAAYWFASQAPPAVRTCHHLHGGMGLDVTYPMHRYSALVKDLVRLLGGEAACLDRWGGSDVRRPD